MAEPRDKGRYGATDYVFRLLLREADERVLRVSPPYGDPRAERAFLSGYDTALRDIANGYLKVPK